MDITKRQATTKAKREIKDMLRQWSIVQAHIEGRLPGAAFMFERDVEQLAWQARFVIRAVTRRLEMGK